MKQHNDLLLIRKELKALQIIIGKYKAILVGKKLEQMPTYWALIPVNPKNSFGRKEQ